MAASATFALKAGLCVRRARLVIVAPDPRHSRRSQAETPLRGVHLTGVERRLGQWNVPTPAPTTLSPLGSFRLGSRLMQTAWTTWNGCDGLTASSARPVVIREDGGLGTAGSCALDARAGGNRHSRPIIIAT